MPNDVPITRLAQRATAVLGVFIALSALPGLWLGLRGSEAWELRWLPLLAAFEFLVMFSAGFAIVYGIRPRRAGYGLAVLCAAGGILTASVLGAIVLKNSSSKVPPLTNVVLARAAASAGLAVLTAVVMLGRSATSWRFIAIGGAMLLPTAILGGLVVTKRVDAFMERFISIGQPWTLILGLAGVILWGVLTVIGGHLVIRAFELTDQESPKEA